MIVYRYEDLDVWKAARSLCAEIYGLRNATAIGRDYALWKQLNSASISVVANIAEGFVRGNVRHKEFAYFVRIAAGSNAETRALLYLAIDRGHLTEIGSNQLIEATNSIGRMLRALEASLNAAPNPEDSAPGTKN
jgi:four helix bundle protein